LVPLLNLQQLGPYERRGKVLQQLVPIRLALEAQDESAVEIGRVGRG
jgi:hypothetical protein